MNEQYNEAEDNARFNRRTALRPSVPLFRHMIYGSGLTNPLDFLILMHIHYMCEDGKDFTVQDLIDALHAEGIRNANGKGTGLVGRKAVYESIARLRAAGFLHRSQGNGGSFDKVTYTFIEFPATDPDWTPPPMPGSTGDLPVSFTGEAVPVGNGIAAGQTASPHRGSADRGSADRPRGKEAIAAGQTASPHRGSGEASPPHPPEGGGNTTPKPPKTGRASKVDRLAEACALHPDDHQPTAEEIKAADAFLQELPGKWEMNIDEARPLAPLLASRVQMLDLDYDTLLELELIKDDPDKPARVPARVMPTRIRALKRRRTEPKAEPQQASGSLAPWCGECNGGERPAMVYQRMVELSDGRDVPCQQCHPKYARTNV